MKAPTPTLEQEFFAAAKVQFNNFIAGWLEANGTHRDDEEAVTEAMSLYFRAANSVKVDRESEFGEDLEDESAAA